MRLTDYQIEQIEQEKIWDFEYEEWKWRKTQEKTLTADIFNEVTSFQELNHRRKNQMPKKNQTVIDDFEESDEVIGSSLEFWNFKEEKEIVGLFQEMVPDNYGYHAVLNTGEIIVHLPNLMALNGKLKSAKVEEGNKVKIVYLGETKSKKSGRVYEDFKIFVKKD
jgi:hypothetical protein